MTGASCQPGPSPTARALRLEGLRAEGPAELRALLAELPDPPWDVEIADGDPLAGPLAAEGFEPYARVAVMARPVAGLPRPPYVSGLEVMPYRNDWAEEFSALEAAAMEGLAAYREMGQPTGYEGAEGFDAFVAARGEGGLMGFAQAMVPEGWINWMGVARTPAGAASDGSCSPRSRSRWPTPAAPIWRRRSRWTPSARRSWPPSGSGSGATAAPS